MSAITEVTVPLLRHHLKTTVDFLKPFLPFVEGHMTRFFTEDLWHKHIAPEIQREIHTESDVREALDIYRHHLTPDTDLLSTAKKTNRLEHFRVHLTNTKHYYLDRFRDVWITPEELDRIFAGASDAKQTNHRSFMSMKKHYEVSVKVAIN